ncbi:hypothetical protein VTL71DRAFT_1574, partial [Oculimacula yallundae]
MGRRATEPALRPLLSLSLTHLHTFPSPSVPCPALSCCVALLSLSLQRIIDSTRIAISILISIPRHLQDISKSYLRYLLPSCPSLRIPLDSERVRFLESLSSSRTGTGHTPAVDKRGDSGLLKIPVPQVQENTSIIHVYENHILAA